MPSTVVADILYNEAASKLTVIFRSGAVYEYHKVPAAVYRQMKAAPSKGTYLNQQVKGVYPFKKLSNKQL